MLPIFINQAHLDKTLALTGPKIPVRFVGLIAPEDQAPDKVVFTEERNLIAHDLPPQLIGLSRVGCEDARGAKLRNHNHLVREKLANSFDRLGQQAGRTSPRAKVLIPHYEI